MGAECAGNSIHGIQSEEIELDPEMDKSAVWAGLVCMAVFPISGSRLISSLCTFGRYKQLQHYISHPMVGSDLVSKIRYPANL